MIANMVRRHTTVAYENIHRKDMNRASRNTPEITKGTIDRITDRNMETIETST